METPDFSVSSRRANLLRYLVSETLGGRGDRLKGTSIAIDVFDRDAGFDPQTDAVVRSEARRLRQALDNYYVGIGAGDPIRIVVPKGSYVPHFEYRWPKAARQTAGSPPEAAGIFPVLSPGAVRPAAPALAPPRPRAFVRAAALLASLALVVIVGSWWMTRPAGLPGAGVIAPSVLVVPFEASGTEAEAFAQGISAQLIADLMHFPDFRLYTFLDSAWRNTDSSDPVHGADYVVRGMVHVDDHNLSAVVRLSDTADGRVMWSEDYTRPLEPSAVVKMQAEIAGEIASAIGQPYGAMLNAVAERVEAANTNGAGMSSFACIMRAYTYRQTNRSDLYPQVRECLEAAVVRDPLYAEAWAMLTYLKLDGGRFGYETSETEAYAAARAAATRALAIDPQSVQAMKALSLVEHYTGHFDESERLARVALALNPNDPDTLAHLGWRLSTRGKFTDGIPYLKRAIERSVKPPAWYFQPIALERLMAGDMEGMLDAAERASADGSSVSDAFLAIAYAGTGQSALAREALDRMAQKWPLLNTDPAAAFGIHRLSEDQIAAIAAGLRAAGWEPPGERVPASKLPD